MLEQEKIGADKPCSGADWEQIEADEEFIGAHWELIGANQRAIGTDLMNIASDEGLRERPKTGKHGRGIFMPNYFYAPYLPRGADDRLDWALNFAQNIASYGARFGLTPPELSDIATSVAALDYARTTLVNYTRSFSKGATAFADELDTDPTPNAMPFPVFSPPAAPSATTSGIFKRLDALIEAKILPVATDAEKTALRLFPIEAPSTVAPEITDLEALMRGQVSLTFRRGGAKLVSIYSRRGSETGLTLLDKVADAHFLDERPNLVAGVGEAREYAIEWSLDGKRGTGVMSPIRTVATLG